MHGNLLLSIVAGCLAVGAPPDDPAEMKNIDALQGKWLAVSCVMNGSRTELVKQDVYLIFKGDKLITVEEGEVCKGTYDLDLTTAPRTLIFTPEGQGDKGKLYSYKLDKELTIWRTSSTTTILMTFQKVKPSTNKPAVKAQVIGAKDEHCRSIYVPVFKNQTLQRGMEFELTQAVIKEIESKTPYRTVSERDGADSELQGTIVKITKNLLTMDQLNESREHERVVTVQVAWRDLRTGKSILLPGREYLAAPFPPFHFRDVFYPTIDLKVLLAAIFHADFSPMITLQCAAEFNPEMANVSTWTEQLDRLAVQVAALMEEQVIGAKDEHCRSIYVPVFKNQSLQRGLGIELRQAVIREIESKTPYKVLPGQDGADSELLGTIEAFTKDHRNQESDAKRLITVRLAWRDLQTGKSVLSPAAVTAFDYVPSEVHSTMREQLDRLAVQIVSVLEKP